MANELVIFGSENLNGRNCHVNRSSDRYSSPIVVSTSPYSRGAGSVVNNTRPSEKTISLSGYIQSDTQEELQDIVDRYERALALQDSWLRITPQWETLYSVITTSAYTSSQGSVQELSEDTPIGSQCFRFYAGGVSNNIEIVSTATSASIDTILGFDADEDVASGSIGLWARDVYGNGSLAGDIILHLGSDSSNYQILTMRPYDGSYRKGWTFYIGEYAPFTTGDLEGDVVTSGSYTYLSYLFNVLNNGGAYEFSDIIWMREKSTRNYPAIKTQFQKSHEHHSINKIDFDLEFINYTGLAMGSFEYIGDTDTTTYADDQPVAEVHKNTGTYSPMVRVDVEHEAGDGFGWGYRVNDGQYVEIASVGTVTGNDSYSVYNDPSLLGVYVNGAIADVSEGIIPTDDWVAGRNRIELAFIEAQTTISQPTYDGSVYVYRQQPYQFDPVAYAQSFTANATGCLYRVDILMAGRVSGKSIGQAQLNAITGAQGVIFGDPFTPDFLNGSTSKFLVSNTPQWISFFPETPVVSGSFYYISIFNSDDARIYTTSTSSYSGGTLWEYANVPGDYGFGSLTQDMAFKTYISTNDSFTANYGIYYRNRYL